MMEKGITSITEENERRKWVVPSTSNMKQRQQREGN